ncbi:MAG: type II secretion system F family protein [Verrucomicrobiia bacterium]
MLLPLTLLLVFAAASTLAWSLVRLYFRYAARLSTERAHYSLYERHRDRHPLARLRPLLLAATDLANALPPLHRWIQGRTPSVSAQLAASGNPANLTAPEFLILKLVAPFLTFLLLILTLGPALLEIVAILSLGAFFLPDLWLNDEKKRREAELLRSLPDSLDTLSLVVGSGLDLGEAIDVYIGGALQTPLVEEFSLVRNQMLMGQPRTDALANMARRVNLIPVKNFTTAVIESTKLGTALSDTLQAQADEMRSRRFLLAEQSGQKAALKIMAPLLLFVIPNVFLILFSPLILSAFQ